MQSLTVVLGCLTVAATCPAQTPTWTQIKPSTSPPARISHSMVYDSARQRTVLFGGLDYQGPFADTWEWDGKNWKQIKPTNSPSARRGFAMAYDSARQRTVLFGGRDLTNILNDTWEYDGGNWTQIKPTNSPSARWHSAMVYDSVRQRTVLFGGLGGVGDTWEWDGSNWTKRNPTTSPVALYMHGMAYDSARQRTVLFGGGCQIRGWNDTWEWDGSNWTQVKPTTSPPQPYRPVLSYDSARQRTVLFGGQEFDNTWEYDGSNWTQIKHTTSGLGPRVWSGLTFDSVRQRTVLFGGLYWDLLNDTWEYGIANLTLTANTPTISIANGGTQTLTLNAGANLKNKSYWIFGSQTSTMPGLVLTGIHIPLNPDLYTAIALVVPNSKEFTNFKGTLNGKGLATASLTVPANLPFLPGFKLYHSYVVFDGTTGQIFTSSSPVSVEFK